MKQTKNTHRVVEGNESLKMSSTFRLKEICYFNRKVKILCQNLNGPCPLLSLCNVLILSGRIHVHSDYQQVSVDMITQLIANDLLERELSQDMPEETRILHQERLEVAISMLPTLQHGLDVNVKFDDVTSFEYTRELDCFDSLSVPLYHGWIYDPQDQVTKGIIQGLSYNHLQYKLVCANSADNNTDQMPYEEGGEKNCSSKEAEEAKVIQKFLTESASQLTYAGLLALYDQISEGSLCSFFRNNHFSTMLKKDGNLYLLVTDMGYADEPTVVWELLDEIDGNTEFVDSNFKPISAACNDTPPVPTSSISASPLVDPDFLTALKLSEEQKAGVIGYAASPVAPKLSEVEGESIPVTVSPSGPNEQFVATSKAVTDSEAGQSNPTANPCSNSQEEQDRKTALLLQAQYDNSYVKPDSHGLEESLSPKEIESYRKAEEEFYRSRNDRKHTSRPPKRGCNHTQNQEKSSGCTVS